MVRDKMGGAHAVGFEVVGELDGINQNLIAEDQRGNFAHGNKFCDASTTEAGQFGNACRRYTAAISFDYVHEGKIVQGDKPALPMPVDRSTC